MKGEGWGGEREEEEREIGRWLSVKRGGLPFNALALLLSPMKEQKNSKVTEKHLLLIKEFYVFLAPSLQKRKLT